MNTTAFKRVIGESGDLSHLQKRRRRSRRSENQSVDLIIELEYKSYFPLRKVLANRLIRDRSVKTEVLLKTADVYLTKYSN